MPDKLTGAVKSNKYDVFRTEAWLKNGLTIYQNLHGQLVLNSETVTMLDGNSQAIFSLPYSDIKKVSISPGSFIFLSSASKKYHVTLYNMARVGSKIAGGPVTGLAGIGLETSALQDVRSSEGATLQIERLLRQHNVIISGSAKISNEKKELILVGVGNVAVIILGGLVLYFLQSH